MVENAVFTKSRDKAKKTDHYQHLKRKRKAVKWVGWDQIKFPQIDSSLIKPGFFSQSTRTNYVILSQYKKEKIPAEYIQ